MARKTFSINSNLADAMNETVNAARNNAGDLRVESIPLNKIELDPNNPRELDITINDLITGILPDDPLKKDKNNNKETLLSLSKSIVDQGVINPIVVYKNGTCYTLIAGERRTLASIIADKKDIPARILNEKPDELKLSLLQWIENIEREDLSLGEKISNLRKIISSFCKINKKDFSSITVDNIQELVGCSKGLASYYKVVLNAPEIIDDAIHNGKINTLKKAALICKSPQEIHESLILACSNGATEKELKLILREFEQSKKNPIKSSSAGAPAKKFKLGSTTNPNVVKLLLESILMNPQFKNFKAGINFDSIEEPKYANKIFNELIKSLEEA